MQATAADGVALFELSSRLRKIGIAVNIALDGAAVPAAVQAQLGLPPVDGPALLAELQGLRARLQELAALAPPAGIGWVAEPPALVAEASRLGGVIADTVLERRADAAAWFRQAAADFRACGMAAQAEDAELKAAAHEDVGSSAIERLVAAARARVDPAAPPGVDGALRLIELGEALLQADNSAEARPVLQRAEALLAEAGHAAPRASQDIRQALLAAVLQQSVGPESVQMAQRELTLRQAFRRLYDGLASALRPVDEPAARRYAELIELHQL